MAKSNKTKTDEAAETTTAQETKAGTETPSGDEAAEAETTTAQETRAGTETPSGTDGDTKPGTTAKTMTVLKHLVGEKLADKQVYRQDGKIKAIRYVPKALGAALAAFNGWAMDREITEAEYAAGKEAFKAKKAGSKIRKGGK